MSRWFEATSFVRDAMPIEDRVAVELRARQARVFVRAGRNTRKGCWRVLVERGEHRVTLEGYGDVGAVIAGAFADFEALDDYTPEELAVIRRQSKDAA